MKQGKPSQIKETKLKPILPVLREKKRFIKIKLESKKKYDFKTLSYSLNNQILYYLGAIDFGKGGVWILKDKFNFEDQTAIIKVSTKFKDKTLAALTLINKIDNDEIKLEIIRISGTLKGVEK
ncbi:MAG: hypothetical protein PF569_06210 [Candidatus Woesearchaeota archaeon]|jgi:RNase P/RNase MRP subunit POP5|nr:hypothetical protein [Candidatus Woesearchaeota archaeon]